MPPCHLCGENEDHAHPYCAEILHEVEERWAKDYLAECIAYAERTQHGDA
jgi:hypothetical protein